MRASKTLIFSSEKTLYMKVKRVSSFLIAFSKVFNELYKVVGNFIYIYIQINKKVLRKVSHITF